MTVPMHSQPETVNPDGHTHDGRYHAHKGGGWPHAHQPVVSAQRRIYAGLGILVISIAAQWLPWLTIGGVTYSVASAHGVCVSGLGQFAQAIDQRAAQNCGAVSAGWGLLWLLTVVGLGLLLWGLFSARDTSGGERV